MTDSPESERFGGVTRRSFLGKALAALGIGAALGSVAFLESQPSSAQQEEEKLWKEYKSNPQRFLAEHQGSVLEGLVVKEEGINLRKSPTARDRSNIIGSLPSDAEIKAAMYASKQGPNDPDGPWMLTERDGQIVFFSQRFVESKRRGSSVTSTQPTAPTNQEPSK